MPDASPASPYKELHGELRGIFAHALAQVDIAAALDRRLSFHGSVIEIVPELDGLPGAEALRIDLAAYNDVLIIALGKAALPMLEALSARLPGGLRLSGLCCGPELPQRTPDTRFSYFAGGHPVPNLDSFRAAEAALGLLRRATERTLVFYLVSGGGSSLFELPLDPEISLEDTIAFHRALVACGATIAEINVVRKHFSAVKGGRLAAASRAARQLTLQVADVRLDQLDSLASAPTLPDRSTVSQCREILARYPLPAAFPPAVQRFFMRPDLPETPGSKDGRKDGRETGGWRSGNSSFVTLLSNDDLIRAARSEAQRRGFMVVVDNACDEWEYERAARYLLERFLALQQQHSRVCLLSGGEVTVRLDRPAGTGGRNQQFALFCARYLHELRSGTSLHCPALKAPIAVFSAGSDGIDGNSPAAGAIADDTTAARAQALGLDLNRALAGFDADTIFRALSDSVVTGYTGNNLRDVRMIAN